LLRRLPDDGETPRFAVFWSTGELGRQWLNWLFLSAIFFGFGAACLFAV